MGWNAQAQYFEIATEAGPTSRICARSLKPSEDAARYSEFAGVTLAGIYVDQPEEMPEDFFAALQAHLSQPGYPHQMLLTPNPHGVATSAADVLRKHGVDLQLFSSANRVDRRDMAIQTVAGYMRRLTPQGSAFRVTPQFVVVTKRGSTPTPVLVDGFEAGYVWDSKSTKGTTNPNTRRPLKYGCDDHGQNCVEYIALMFGPGTSLKPAPTELSERTYPVDSLSRMSM